MIRITVVNQAHPDEGQILVGREARVAPELQETGGEPRVDTLSGPLGGGLP